MTEIPGREARETESLDHEDLPALDRIIEILHKHEVNLITADELKGKDSHQQQQIVLWTLKEMGFTAKEAEDIGQECFPNTWEGSAW